MVTTRSRAAAQLHSSSPSQRSRTVIGQTIDQLVGKTIDQPVLEPVIQPVGQTTTQVMAIEPKIIAVGGPSTLPVTVTTSATPIVTIAAPTAPIIRVARVRVRPTGQTSRSRRYHLDASHRSRRSRLASMMGHILDRVIRSEKVLHEIRMDIARIQNRSVKDNVIVEVTESSGRSPSLPVGLHRDDIRSTEPVSDVAVAARGVVESVVAPIKRVVMGSAPQAPPVIPSSIAARVQPIQSPITLGLATGASPLAYVSPVRLVSASSQVFVQPTQSPVSPLPAIEVDVYPPPTYVSPHVGHLGMSQTEIPRIIAPTSPIIPTVHASVPISGYGVYPGLQFGSSIANSATIPADGQHDLVLDVEPSKKRRVTRHQCGSLRIS